MIRKYIKIIFDYINGLRKYRWLHIAVFIQLLLIIFSLTIISPAFIDITENGFYISIILSLMCYFDACFIFVLICIFSIFQLLKFRFKGINITKNKFLLYSPAYTPFFLIGLIGIALSCIASIIFLYIMICR